MYSALYPPPIRLCTLPTNIFNMMLVQNHCFVPHGGSVLAYASQSIEEFRETSCLAVSQERATLYLQAPIPL